MAEPFSAQDIAKEWKRFVHEDEAWWAGSVLEEIANTMVAMRTELTTRIAALEQIAAEREGNQASLASLDGAHQEALRMLGEHVVEVADLTARLAAAESERERFKGVFGDLTRRNDRLRQKLQHVHHQRTVVEQKAKARRGDLEARLAAAEQERDELRDMVETLRVEFAPVKSHTARPMTMTDLANLLDKISRPVTQESVPLSDDPDDYPVTEEAHDATK